MPKAVVALDQNVEGLVDPTAELFSDQLDCSDLAACEDLEINRSPASLLSISTTSVGLCLGGPWAVVPRSQVLEILDKSAMHGSHHDRGTSE